MASTELRVGLCGFTIALADYPRRFPVVEVQQTFYEPPADATLAKWRANAPALEYTMKVWQLVTHAATSPTYRRAKDPLHRSGECGGFRDSALVMHGWRRSVECASLLSASAMLFQTPASFGPERGNVERMRAFFARIERPAARLMWEPRGARWTAERGLARALCDELGLVHVVDPFVTPPAPADVVYWRLHGAGAPRHAHDDAQLRDLHAMVGRCTRGPAYVMFNHLPRVADAERFIELAPA